MKYLLHFFAVSYLALQANAQPTYETHPCMRTCEIGRPQNCYYDFTLEYYYTLSRECSDCPFNKTDCFRPRCIPAQGTSRAIIVANRMMPGPAIHVCQGDTVIVRVMNKLVGSDGTSIHWHGIHQRGSPYMDGVSMVTQCLITANTEFKYRFNASQAGTNFWHGHPGLQSVDGLFGALVVRQPVELESHHGMYEEDRPEHMMFVNEWNTLPALHDFVRSLHGGKNTNAVSMLINGKGMFQEFIQADDNTTHYTPVEVFHVTQGSRFRFRVIANVLNNCPIQISIDNHTLTMMASDGVPFKMIDVDSFYIHGGERYDYVLNASSPVGNYWIRARALGFCRRRVVKQVAILRYVGAPDSDPIGTTTWEDANREGKILNPQNGEQDENNIPVSWLVNRHSRDMMPTFKDVPDKTFYFAFNETSTAKFVTYNDAEDLWQINNITNKMPSAPLLGQMGDVIPSQFCHHESWQKRDCSAEFCECTHLLQTDLGDDVELVLVGGGERSIHPMHLHGYSFHVVAMALVNDTTTMEEVKQLDRQGLISRNLTHSVAKDTVTVQKGGYVIVRFKADNPGFWFFHCHVQSHMRKGMSVIIQTGQLSDMPRPPKNFPRCGSWSYTGEGEPREDKYASQGCTSSAQMMTVNAAVCVLPLLLQMMNTFL